MANPRAVRELQEGLGLHQKGNLQGASAAYGRVLAIDPGNTAALQYLAAAEVALGRTAAAADHARRAAELAPADLGLVENVVSILLMAGDAAGALALCDRALPRYGRSIRLHYARAVARFRLRQFRQALEAFDAVLALDPKHVDALNERGSCLAELHDYASARASIERALALAPGKAEAHFNLGRIQKALQEPEAACAALEKAILSQPRYTEAIEVWAEVMSELKRYEAGLATCQAMIGRDPNFEGGHAGAAILLNNMKRSEQALAFADRATSLAPGKTTLHRTRATILQALKRWSEAAAAYERTYRLDPLLPDVVGLLIHNKLHAVEWGGIDTLIEACRRNPSLTGSFEALGFCDDAAVAMAAAKARATSLDVIEGAIFSPATHRPRPRLTLAYVSADFRDHPVSRLLVGVLEKHDRARFEVIGVALKPEDGSEIGSRVRAAFDGLVEADAMDDHALVRAVRDRQVDIAIDLMGHTDETRLVPFAHRIAPVQATWLGYAGTVGTPCIDYLIADPMTIPPDQFGHYVEKIVHLPDTYMPTDNRQPIAETAITRAEAGLPETGFVFCCFNQLFKILPATFESWMRILSRTPGSVLWLPGANTAAVDHLRREAQARGIAPERLVFASRVPTNAEHLARLRCVDLSLDTLPYNSHTTAVDTLWAGTPLLTRLGNAFAGRVAAGLLHAVGLPELVTTSAEEYEALAVRLAAEPGRLADIRRRLDENRKTRALFDTQRFTRHIEVAFETMWERFCQGLPPAAFAVTAIDGKPGAAQAARF